MNYPAYFFHSLVKISKTRLALAILVSVLMFIPLDLFFRFGLVHFIPEYYVTREPRDDFAHAFHAAAVARGIPSNVTPFYVMGGSGMRVAMMTGPEVSRIANEVGGSDRYQGFILTSNSRNLAHDLASLDMIRDRPGIIVYGLSYNRLAQASKNYESQILGKGMIGRNYLLLDYLDENHPQLARLDFLTRFLSSETYILPATRLLSERAKLLLTPVKFSQHRDFTEQPEMESRDRENQLKKWLKNKFKNNSLVNSDLNMELLAHFIRQAQLQGHKVIVVEQPIDHEYLQGRLDAAFEFYRSRLEKLVVELGATYQNFEQELGFGSDMFRDLQHLKSAEASEIYTRRVIEIFAKPENQN